MIIIFAKMLIGGYRDTGRTNHKNGISRYSRVLPGHLTTRAAKLAGFSFDRHFSSSGISEFFGILASTVIYAN